MPIIFKCSCGKYLAVSNKYSGKRLSCPGCKSIIYIPLKDYIIKKIKSSKKT